MLYWLYQNAATIYKATHDFYQTDCCGPQQNCHHISIFFSLSLVEFGDVEGLDVFLFENSTQHQLFRDTFFEQGIQVAAFPIVYADPENLDDWLLAHQVEHQFFASQLGLSNPFNMLDADWRKEDDFYQWLAEHVLAHEQIAGALGLT